MVTPRKLWKRGDWLDREACWRQLTATSGSLPQLTSSAFLRDLLYKANMGNTQDTWTCCCQLLPGLRSRSKVNTVLLGQSSKSYKRAESGKIEQSCMFDMLLWYMRVCTKFSASKALSSPWGGGGGDRKTPIYYGFWSFSQIPKIPYILEKRTC